MHPALLHAYAAMRERLQAEEALEAVELATVTAPQCDPGYRRGVMARWQHLASQEEHAEYDDHGRELLRGSGAVRHWLASSGGFGQQETGG